MGNKMSLPYMDSEICLPYMGAKNVSLYGRQNVSLNGCQKCVPIRAPKMCPYMCSYIVLALECGKIATRGRGA